MIKFSVRILERIKRLFRYRPVPYSIDWIRENAARQYEDETENDL